MIVCGNSKIVKVTDGWKVEIDGKIGDSLSLYEGQTLFGVVNEETRRLFLSPLRLNPSVSYFRIFLEDIMGSLSNITDFFSRKGVNILSGGAFGLGNLWVSEFVVDFRNVDVTAEDIVNDIEGMGGFVTYREITELFPKAFELKDAYTILTDEGGRMYLILKDVPGEKINQAILKAWPRVQALFLDFYSEDDKLLEISARIRDVPGSLNNLAQLLKNQVDLVAIDERHHDEVSGEWTIYGKLEIGDMGDLRGKAGEVSSIIELDVKPLGWKP
jgi:hypothetical protein